MIPRPALRLVTASACLVPCALLAGCGSLAVGDVTGTVSYQGKPVTSGVVSFTAGDGLPYTCAITPDGTYAIQQVPTGFAMVTVISPDPEAPAAAEPERKRGDGSRQPPAAPKPSGRANSKWFPIPEHYGLQGQSGLSLDVKKGPNTFNIDLK
jgi:hypothetical protein